MKYFFPDVKTVFPGFAKFHEELKEFEEAPTEDNQKEELIDLYHCVEVWMKVLFKDEEELHLYLERVKEKNIRRGLYKI